MNSFVFLWALLGSVAVLLGISAYAHPQGQSRVFKLVGIVVIVSMLVVATADRAMAAPTRVPAENRNVQCVAGGMGVAGAWLGTLGSAPTTAGLVTGAAATAATGATIAWYDMCPEYGNLIIRFMNPTAIGFWSAETLGGWFFNHQEYERTGRFCVVRPGQSTKRCFLWKNLSHNQMRKAFRSWLGSYNIPARLYTGQLRIAH